MLTTYQEAYADAIQRATDKGLEISPANPDWQAFWQTYRAHARIPEFGLHTTLTESGPKVYVTVGAPTTTAAPTAPTATITPTSTGDVDVEFVSVTSPVKLESTITVVVKTEPNAACRLVMTLSDGTVSGFPKDPEKIADADGNVSWEWQLFRHTPLGETKLEVTATVDGSTGAAVTSFIAE